MNLIFRLIRICIAALLRPKLGLLDPSQVRLRVWPNDLDFNLHMNNGRYFTLMDLGRIDLMIRTGVVRWMWRQKWTPVVGSETIRFRRALKPFQPYLLKTRVLCWDERWVFLEQRFESEAGELAALGIVKAVLTAERRTMRPKEALKIMGMLRRSPPMPPAVKAWALAEEWMAEPRGAQIAADAQEAVEPAVPAATTPTAPDGQPTAIEIRAGRFAAWRKRVSSTSSGSQLVLPKPPQPVPEPVSAPVEAEAEPEPVGPPPTMAGRFGQWRRRRAS